MEAGTPAAQEQADANASVIVVPKPDRNRKRLKLEHKQPLTTDIAQLRQQISDHKRKCQEELKEAYRDNLAELFYLQHGLNIMDFPTWRKKPNPLLSNFLTSYSFDPQEADAVHSLGLTVKTEPGVADLRRVSSTSSTALMTPTTIDGHIDVIADNLTSSEAIVEQAKKEAHVMQRIAELRKQGLWSARRLPKVQEPSRGKAHWDYLLEEMQWLAADFAQERKWKKAGCRKISRMVLRYHQEKLDDEKKAEKEESYRLKRIAGQMAKQIKDFWSNIEKVVKYKHDSRLDEKRRQALDLHLNFIVDQTEKYSSWLSAGLAGTAADTSVTSSVTASPRSSVHMEDQEFEPGSASSDDEETIAKEEQYATDQNETDAELAALQAESEMPLDELIAKLPPEVLEKPAPLDYSSSSDQESSSHDDEFSGGENEGDDEQTLEEQEEHEDRNYEDELQALKDEGEMSVEELAAKYAGAYASDFELPDTPSSSEAESDDGESENQDTSSDEEAEEGAGEEHEEDDVNKDEEDIGMEYLLHPEKDEAEILSERKGQGEGPGREITDIAATAQSLQPTGYTLETTVVKTPVPFLLKHSLREYQHVGLDWLATMYDKKLNGILADEMGLGKTIQTISLLAHLACEHGVWGPHLIVVPTSVMLNWEMEFKKWCPGFKILTYYGSQKERKMKRVGWTKTNAFHVCITSYKLVIQDHVAFRRKKWKYLILDEAHNIKNFKSQRWQTLLNFSSQRRLLLTGTPLQNNLMELWSLMHFLMPNVFQSHMEFKEWFANPLTGMIEGNNEYNEQLIRRLHKVLRPFLLRRLKADVERQLPKKYEHVVLCKLSKRQRLLYEEFMARRETKDVLASGNFMSVINILMQLRKVCNHPDMFDPRPIVSPFEMEPITLEVPADILRALERHPMEQVKLNAHNPLLADMELDMTVYSAHRGRELQTSRKLIEMLDDLSDPPVRTPPTKLRPFVIRAPTSTQSKTVLSGNSPAVSISSSILRPTSAPASSAVKTAFIRQEGGLVTTAQLTSLVSPTITSQAVRAALTSKTGATTTTSQPITLQIQQTPQGTRLMIPSSQLSQLQAGFVNIIQTSSGQHLITSAANAQSIASGNSRIVPISSVSVASGTASSAPRPHSVASAPVATVDPVTGRPVLKVPPMTSSNTNVVLASTLQTGATTVKSAVGLVSGNSSSVQITNGATSHQTAVKSSSVPPSVKSSSSSGKVLLGPASRKRALLSDARQKFESELLLSNIEDRKAEWRQSQIKRLVCLNKRNSSFSPVYGRDLHQSLDVWYKGIHQLPTTFSANSAVNCFNASEAVENLNFPAIYNNSTSYLKQMILNRVQRLDQLKDVLERFVFVTPTVKASTIKLHSPCKSDLVSYDQLVHYATKKPLKEGIALLHPIQTRMLVQFPDKRLIQYDCGKLQTLDILLRDLKQAQHRVLIFTQMTRMLDVLETFLNYHGHRYLRLDGTTRVEMRQALMDRFNADKRIFVFILSTRSGGIGVNLTGADTVIFYDSDWNPTMDAQAQDRCHRIGQTRDVHIYRLISEKTVEENILKKANQKRLLGDVAIEGGNFTTATLQHNTISELFAEPSGLQSLVDQKKQAFESDAAGDSQELSTSSVPAVAPTLNDRNFEQALCQAEDDEDVKAAAIATEEAGAELAEFDENIPWDEREAENSNIGGEKTSKVEMEIAMLEKELTPVERYALRFIETTDDQFSEDAVKQAELDIDQAKRDWELNRMKQQKEEEERRADLEEDDMLFTYTTEDGMNQAFKDTVTGENMPMWCPPTPPRLENDVYVDQSMCFLYDSAVMSESQLPPVYVKKEKKRPRDQLGSVGGLIPKKKSKLHEEAMPRQHALTSSHRPPRSLFDRPHRDNKSLLRHPGLPSSMLKMGARSGLQKTPQTDSSHQDQPEWLIHEDWSLLQAVQTLLQLPLNLTAPSPAHIPNWDLVADIVSTTSRIYRSSKQCRLRYENVIIPREEGKLLYEPNPRKTQKKIPKSVQKQSKGIKPMKTDQLYSQDCGSSVTTLHAFRFDCIKNVAGKRTPTLRPTLVNPTMKNPKHAAVIQETGINYENPMTPEEVAKIRQERIRTQKTKEAQEQQQQRVNQGAVGHGASVSAQGVQLQHLTTATGATAIISPASKTGVSIARTLPGNIVVNSPATFTKRLTGSQSSSVISGVTAVTQATTVTGQRKLTVQEMNQLRNNPAAMSQFMQRIQQSGGTVAGSPRTITVQQPQQAILQSKFSPAQLTMLKQQHQKAVGQGATLVAQRTASSTTAQLLTGQTVQQSGTTNVAIPVSAAAINVSLAQRSSLTPTTGQQGVAVAKTLTANPQQFRQIQLLQANKQTGRHFSTQKLGLSQHPLVKQGASVQIVQQKVPAVGQKIGVQQIQQLIKQQQAQQQHTQIITAPASAGGAATGGQTIIATTPANMQATITRMSTPTTNIGAGLSNVSNVTVSLARPSATSGSAVAIVPSSVTPASLVNSPSKVVASSGPRPAASQLAHRVAGTATITTVGGTTPVISLSSITLQSQQSPSTSIVTKTLPFSAVQTLQGGASQGTTILHTRTPVSTIQQAGSATTVLQKTVLTNKSGVTAALIATQPSVVTPAVSAIVTPVNAPQPASQPSSGTSSTTQASTSITSVQPIVSMDNLSVAETTVITTDTSNTADIITVTSEPQVSDVTLMEPSGMVPDSTRTYAMRPRKTTEK